MSDNKIEPVEATVSELRPGMRSVNITFKVMKTSEEREVESRRDGATHRVLDAVVGDSTGTIQMPVWDGAIKSIEAGETYLLSNGYTGLFKNSLRLHLGKMGTIARASKPISEVNQQLDMSAEIHSSR